MEERHPHISVVTPAYRCADCLPELCRRLIAALGTISPDFEIIIVNDCSPERDWEAIKSLARSDARIKGIGLSRNFGQHYAITAGLDYAFGDWVVVMDCDLQDQPEEIQKLYRVAQEGYDIVFARRHSRQDGIYRKLPSRLFSLICNYLGDINADSTVANFSISSQRAIAYVRKFRERNRSFPSFLREVGFRRTSVDVEHAERFSGETSYTFGTLLDLAIQSVVSQSNKPLRLFIRFGFTLAIGSMCYASWIVLQYYFHSITVEGWTSLIVLTSFLFGVLFANLGVLGLYLGKVFDEVKGRPLYCVQETCNLHVVDGLQRSDE